MCGIDLPELFCSDIGRISCHEKFLQRALFSLEWCMSTHDLIDVCRSKTSLHGVDDGRFIPHGGNVKYKRGTEFKVHVQSMIV